MKIIVRFLTVAVLIHIGSAAAVSDELERSLLFPANMDIEEGKTLATEACGNCHSLDGVSLDPNLPHLAGQHVIYLYDELNAYKNGEREDESMEKAVEFLSDDAFRKVSIYYTSLVPPSAASQPITSTDVESKPDPAADDPVKMGQAAAAACAGCHGAGGNSQMPGMPNLTAQPPEYFVAAMKAYQSGGRPGNMMTGLVVSIDEQTIENMALYYALQEPHGTAAAGTGDVEAGRAAAQACSGCHGADGNVTAADMPTLAGQDAAYLAVSLRTYAQGKRDHAQMVTATTELSDADIESLAAFYARQEPLARKVHIPPSIADWIERCDRCHGVGGNSSIPRYPSLASQNERYLARVIETYANGERENSTMSAMSQPLRPADIAALAAHYASQARKSVLYVELPCTPATEQ